MRMTAIQMKAVRNKRRRMVVRGRTSAWSVMIIRDYLGTLMDPYLHSAQE